MEMEEVKYEKIICPVCETEQLECRRNCIHCGITLTKTVDTVDELKKLLYKGEHNAGLSNIE